MSKSYPYIQNRSKQKSGICSVCKEHKQIVTIEWRVDWFQGNCEDEDICQSCFQKRENEERKKQAIYEKKMEPIWKRQREEAEKAEKLTREIISQLGLSLQKFSNGQWNIGGVIDWWTTTGTAIERKSRKHHHLSFKRPEEIKKILLSLI